MIIMISGKKVSTRHQDGPGKRGKKFMLQEVKKATEVNGCITISIHFVRVCKYLNIRICGDHFIVRNRVVKKWWNRHNFGRSSSRVWTEMIDNCNHNWHWHCRCLVPFTLSQLRSMMMNWLRLVFYKFYLLFWL